MEEEDFFIWNTFHYFIWVCLVFYTLLSLNLYTKNGTCYIFISFFFLLNVKYSADVMRKNRKYLADVMRKNRKFQLNRITASNRLVKSLINSKRIRLVWKVIISSNNPPLFLCGVSQSLHITESKVFSNVLCGVIGASCVTGGAIYSVSTFSYGINRSPFNFSLDITKIWMNKITY